jgi:hypothetical protein
MPSASVEDELPAGIPDDSGHDPNRHVSFGQNGTLLDVKLEKRSRKRPSSGDERSAPDASDLFSAKHDNGAGSDALDHLDRRDDPKRAVEAPALRDRVEMRADPAGV